MVYLLLNLLATPVTLCKGWQSGSNIHTIAEVLWEFVLPFVLRAAEIWGLGSWRKVRT